MVLIPPDIGLRLRQQTELLTQPVTPVKEIPGDLPDLKTGQVFNARIQEVLPENTYRAIVAGKTITLALPESVKSGDLLELVVLDRTPKAIIAQLAAQGGPATQTGAAAYPHATFSQAAQLIGTLLPAEGQAPSAAPLNRGQPLLAQPPQNGAELAPVLSKAVTESGLFYESHQAQWVAGKLPLANLMQEPQGMKSSPQAKIAAQADKLLLLANLQQTPQAQPSPQGTASLQAGKQPLPLPGQPQETPAALPGANPVPAGKLPLAAPLQEPNTPLAQVATPAGTGEAAGHPKEVAAPQQPGSQAVIPNPLAVGHDETSEAKHLQTGSSIGQTMTAASIPDELRPLVQQQLDAAGTQRLIWHGEIWPGQTMQWQIEWEGRNGGNPDQNDTEPWSTTLRMTTPRLGEVEAGLRLGAGGVRIALSTPFGGTAADLRDAAPQLEQALASAGVPMRGFTVRQSHGPEPESTGMIDDGS